VTTLHEHPLRALGVIFASAVGCFLLSASGQAGSFWSSGPAWLGAIGWLAFLALLLVLVLSAGYAITVAARRRRTT
jgi:hypothetical protein